MKWRSTVFATEFVAATCARSASYLVRQQLITQSAPALRLVLNLREALCLVERAHTCKLSGGFSIRSSSLEKKIDKDVRVKTSGRVIAVSQTSDSSAVGLHAGKTTFISQRKGLTVSWY